MKKRPSFAAGCLLLLCLAVSCILLLSGLRTQTLLSEAELKADAALQRASELKQELADVTERYTAAIDAQNAAFQQTEAFGQAENSAPQTAGQEPAADGTSENSSVFSQTPAAASNGFVIGLDPGHQSENVDMSATEPNGPGSSVMKTMSSAGTTGSYTGIPEYKLNLAVSLKLKSVLEARGYQVVLTRVDNETAISNAQRAQLVAQQGADIYVRIHANGEESHTVSGALSMSPSAENPYVSYLYEDSTRLSQCILDAYCTATGFANLGVQYYDDMTGINWSTVPVTILEMGFMTYESDDRQMNDDAFQNTMAEGIADGIDAYFGI